MIISCAPRVVWLLVVRLLGGPLIGWALEILMVVA
jgi:hypothetical protein